MAKLDLYEQYYYGDSFDDVGCGFNECSYDTDYDQLTWAFQKLSELDIRPGRENYNEYMRIKTREKMYREKMLNGTGLGDGKGNFSRVG